MSPLTQLPTELRQQILLLVLPASNCVEAPANFIHLSHINKSLRHDMRTVNALWTPTHYISHPSSLTAREPFTRGYNLTRICLDLFSTAFLGRIMWRFGTQNSSYYAHPELIEAWSDAVPFLASGVKELWLDVTPAPAEKRKSPPALLDVFVSEDLPATRFLKAHVGDVAALIGRIDQHYGDCVRIRLTGRLSVRSSFFVKAVGRKVGREIEFTGSWVSVDDARRARLSATVAQETLCPLAREGGRCRTHTLAWLSGVVWSSNTGSVYARVVDEGLGNAVMQEVKKMGQLRDGEARTEEGVLVLPAVGRLRRAFQHRVAADLGFKTVETGDVDVRHVVVRY